MMTAGHTRQRCQVETHLHHLPDDIRHTARFLWSIIVLYASLNAAFEVFWPQRHNSYNWFRVALEIYAALMSNMHWTICFHMDILKIWFNPQQYLQDTTLFYSTANLNSTRILSCAQRTFSTPYHRTWVVNNKVQHLYARVHHRTWNYRALRIRGRIKTRSSPSCLHKHKLCANKGRARACSRVPRRHNCARGGINYTWLVAACIMPAHWRYVCDACVCCVCGTTKHSFGSSSTMRLEFTESRARTLVSLSQRYPSPHVGRTNTPRIYFRAMIVALINPRNARATSREPARRPYDYRTLVLWLILLQLSSYNNCVRGASSPVLCNFSERPPLIAGAHTRVLCPLRAFAHHAEIIADTPWRGNSPSVV